MNLTFVNFLFKPRRLQWREYNTDKTGDADSAIATRDTPHRGFHLMKTALRNWTGSKNFILTNPKKGRANFVWDTALCFTIGSHHQIGEAAITFITSDGPIKTAATEAKCSERVMTLYEYLASINFLAS